MNIPIQIGQSDFVCLSKYLTIAMNLIDQLKTNSKPSQYKIALKKIAPYVPDFLKLGNESLTNLQRRVTSTGLTMREIEDILSSISQETSVHVRRPGKKRLFCKSFLERSPSEDEEINRQKPELHKVLGKKRAKTSVNSPALEFHSPQSSYTECDGPNENSNTHNRKLAQVNLVASRQLHKKMQTMLLNTTRGGFEIQAVTKQPPLKKTSETLKKSPSLMIPMSRPMDKMRLHHKKSSFCPPPQVSQFQPYQRKRSSISQVKANDIAKVEENQNLVEDIES